MAHSREKYFKKASFLFFIASLSLNSVELSDLNDKAISEAHEIAEKIAANCSSPNCFNVFVGRSGTIFYDILRLKGRENLLTLPISDMRYRLESHNKNGERNNLEYVLSVEDKKYLKNYMREHVADKLPKGARVNFIDLTISGQSLASVQSHFAEFFSSIESSSTSVLTTHKTPRVRAEFLEASLMEPEMIHFKEGSFLSHFIHQSVFDRVSSIPATKNEFQTLFKLIPKSEIKITHQELENEELRAKYLKALTDFYDPSIKKSFLEKLKNSCLRILEKL